MIPPIVLALAARELDISVLVGWAFALAASTFCPLLLLGHLVGGADRARGGGGADRGLDGRLGDHPRRARRRVRPPGGGRAAQPAGGALGAARVRDDGARLARATGEGGARPSAQMLALHAPEGLTGLVAALLALALVGGRPGRGRPPGLRRRRRPAPARARRGWRRAGARGASATSRWLGHGSSRPVRHAGSSPPGRRPRSSTARREQPERLHERKRTDGDHLQRADDRAEDAHEARQQPRPHRVQRDQHQRGGERQRGGQLHHLGGERSARRGRARSPPRRCALRRGRRAASRTRPIQRIDGRDRPSARRRSPAGRSRA